MYPNPVRNELRIMGELIENGELKMENIEIFDVVGRKIQSKIVNLQSEIVIDVSHLASGMYFIKVDGNNVGRFGKE